MCRPSTYYRGSRGHTRTLWRFRKHLLPHLQGLYCGSFHTSAGCWSACIGAWFCQILLPLGRRGRESIQIQGRCTEPVDKKRRGQSRSDDRD